MCLTLQREKRSFFQRNTTARRAGLPLLSLRHVDCLSSGGGRGRWLPGQTVEVVNVPQCVVEPESLSNEVPICAVGGLGANPDVGWLAAGCG